MLRGLRSQILFAIGCLLLCQHASAQQSYRFTPITGLQSAENSHRATLVPVYRQGFESGLAGTASGEVALTSDPGEVIAGRRSVKLLPPWAVLTLPSDEVRLAPRQIYVVELRYRVLDRSNFTPLGIAVRWSGLPADAPALGGPNALYAPAEGTWRVVVRTADELDAHVLLFNDNATVLIDEVAIYRHAVGVGEPRPPLPSAAFPRLGNYSLFSPDLLAINNGLTLEQTLEGLALYDVVTGYEIDHTFGDTGGAFRLRERNPDLWLFPYFNPFVSQMPEVTSLGGSAGTQGLFNEGLADAWFMRQPDGTRLFEPHYPTHFQLNHTAQAPPVQGVRYPDYALHFLTRTVLPSGLWQGVHFDQAEWYPNPLLREGDPYLGQGGALPPIDLDGDGAGESTAALFDAWRAAYHDFFMRMRAAVGSATLLFGNAGAIPSAPGVLSALNGWQAEFVRPYPMAANGDLDTAFSGVWYDLMDRYAMADRFTRAPQLNILQFTGFGLGEPNGRRTANGLLDRTQHLEIRDFRRMRLGLASTLLYDGFFGYTYVDNTTAPLWFDEFAVDANGNPVRALHAKGYLGQPLGAAQEIANDAVTLINADFESIPPNSLQFGADARITQRADEVVAGGQSLVFTSSPEQPFASILTTLATELPLLPGKTYHLSIDYKVLDYRPRNYLALLYAGFTAPGGLPSANATAALYHVNVDGPGQSGTLRTALKVSTEGMAVTAALADLGSVAIDNIRVAEGAGGAFRRDFENGVVLVNPTPEPIALTQAMVAGPLVRTGLRRLRGAQDPVWNNGQPVDGGIVLPSGDGIVLLADALPAQALAAPAGLVAATAGESAIDVGWTSTAGPVAGYLVHYGEAGGDLTRWAVAGKAAGLRVENLYPGRAYTFRVAAFDYRGQTGPFSTPLLAVTAGSEQPGPALFGTPSLVPGTPVTLWVARATDTTAQSTPPEYTLMLADSAVFVNGMPASLVEVSPVHVTFLVPWEIEGDHAVVRMEYRGISGPERRLPVLQVAPTIWTWDGTWAIALHSDTLEPVSEQRPARPGDRVMVACAASTPPEPPPAAGLLPPPGTSFRLRELPAVYVGGLPAEVVGVQDFYGVPGTYGVSVLIPSGIDASSAAIAIAFGNRRSEEALLPSQ
jgi:uncharacterized protein (TIGR03437 family)